MRHRHVRTRSANGRVHASKLVPQSTMESLEPRLMMSATLTHGIWTIRPDDAAVDTTIIVSPDQADATVFHATINGQDAGTVSAADVRLIRLFGGTGNDTLRVDLPDTNIRAWLYGGKGDDVLSGGGGNDRLSGSYGNDTLNGGGGDDILTGSRGDDIIDGGAGNDRLYGEAGNDTLRGGDGDDWLVGGAGTDNISGDGGADTILGGTGDDVIDGGDGSDRIWGQWGDDILRGGGGLKDTFSDRTGKNLVYYRPGIDNVNTSKGSLSMNADTGALVTNDGPGQQLQQALIDSAVAKFQDEFGQPFHWWWDWCGGGGIRPLVEGGVAYASASGDGTQMLPLASASDSSSSSDYSTTNTQVAGVDEADIVKTDGHYLYILSGQELVIVDASVPDTTHIVSRTTLDGSPQAMYLYNGRLTIVTNILGSYVDPQWNTDAPIALGSPGEPVADLTAATQAGGVSHDAIVAGGIRAPWYYRWYAPKLSVTVYDVADPASLVTVEHTEMDGYLADSRSIDDRVYLVVRNDTIIPQPQAAYDDATGNYVYESEASYRQRLTDTLADRLPDFTATGQNDQSITGSLLQDQHTYLPSTLDDDNATSVVLFNTSDDVAGPVASTSVFGVNGQVYASADNLYIVGQSWMSWRRFNDTQTSNVYKFSLGSQEVNLEATGTVPGWVGGQFAMDENNGFLRVATSNFFNQQSNSIYVLEQQGDQMNVVGSVMDLGLGEQLKSIRFMGDSAFLVTFHQVDPLFTLDLSDPYQPELMGELTITGYSSYLQPIDATHLLGFGRDADPVTGRTTGLQLSLFDVSDLSDPTLDATYHFDTGGYSWSAAEWDHHAFSYFADQGILAVPTGNWWGDSSYLLEVLKVTPATDTTAASINLLGQVEHGDSIQRSLRIGDNLFSLSSNTLKVSQLTDPSQHVATVDLIAQQPPIQTPLYTEGTVLLGVSTPTSMSSGSTMISASSSGGGLTLINHAASGTAWTLAPMTGLGTGTLTPSDSGILYLGSARAASNVLPSGIMTITAR